MLAIWSLHISPISTQKTSSTMTHPTLPPSTAQRQRGMTMMETLIAIVVMALAILGVLAMQMRVLAETQTSVRRAQSIRLIESLAEQVRLNPGSSSDAVAQAYIVNWAATQSRVSCSGTTQASCELAKEAVQNWKQTVRQTLPGGDVRIFFTAADGMGVKRQLGVMVAWRDGEQKTGDTNKDAQLRTPFNITAPNEAGADVLCGYDSESEARRGQPKTCHLQYIPLNTRCLPDHSGGPNNTLYRCPEGLRALASS